MKSLNEQILCYLTPSAVRAVRDIMACGIEDEDLALSILESLWTEEEIYSLDGDSCE